MQLFSKTIVLLLILASSNARADVIYQIDDGSAELALGIDPGEDMIWLNTFPVEPGGEVITSISASFGRPGLATVLNGLSIGLLLYEDQNGGSPQDAVLKSRTEATVANANTNVLNNYSIVPTEVHGTLVAGVLFRNTTNEQKFIGAVDRTAPTFTNRSYAGFAVGLDEFNLSSIPAGQFQPLEGFNISGNLVVRAVGQAVPEPASFSSVVAAVWALRRLRGQPLYRRS